MSTIRDDDLGRLLEEVASSYDVPEHGVDEVLGAIADQPVKPPVVRRPWVQLSSAIAAAAAAALFFALNDGDPTVASHSAPTNRTALAGGEAAKGDAYQRSANNKLSYGQFSPQYGGTWSSGTFGDKAGASGGVAAPAPAAAYAPSQLTSAPGALAPAAVVPAAPPVSAAVGGAPADDGAGRVVKTGSIALVVEDKRVSPTLQAVEAAARKDGGYISSGTTNEYGDTPSGELTIRVPVDKFEDLVAQVRALDAKVRTQTTSGKDVTAQYSDLDSQLKSLKASRDRFYTILTRTKTISEILTVQQRIDGVSEQIDRIEGQRKLLASQSDLATLTVSVSEKGDPVVKATAKPRSGISQAFQNAKDGFVTGVESIISHSGRALLWLLCLGVIALLARSGWRVARRRLV